MKIYAKKIGRYSVKASENTVETMFRDVVNHASYEAADLDLGCKFKGDGHGDFYECEFSIYSDQNKLIGDTYLESFSISYDPTRSSNNWRVSSYDYSGRFNTADEVKRIITQILERCAGDEL